jgi:hypothetical protein
MSACRLISGTVFPATTRTAEWAGLKGKKNGDLLRSAEAAGYDVLLTVDHGIPHQHRFAGSAISIILIRSRTNQLEDLEPLADTIIRTLESIDPGETREVSVAH